MATEIKFEDLKQELPYKWRVQSFSKFKPEATCVAYVDSRDVQKLLDNVVGPENWQDEYYEVKNNLFCRIGIRVNGEWTWKGDCGTESNVDKEKGEASDAFKRAAVKWGIGRFLYDLGMHKLRANEQQGASKNTPYPVDDSGNRIWDITKHINAFNASKKTKAAPKPEPGKVATAKAAINEAVENTSPATEEQKEEFKELLMHDAISDTIRVERMKHLNSFTQSQIKAKIEGIKGVIAKHEAGIKNAAA